MNLFMQTFALMEMSLSCSVIFIWLLQQFSPKEIPLTVKVLFVLLVSNVFFWPLGLSMELPLAAYVRGATGDLSIVSLLLLWSTLLPSNKPMTLGFKFTIALIALLFYPFALGLSMFDPYAWGYGSIAFLIAIVLFAVICGLANWSKGVWIISLAILAWAAHWHESANLWDYILDPFLAIWAIFSLVRVMQKRRRDKARSGYLFRPG